ncbi:FecR family protein [Pontibacter sp. 13R65]|uniref:FecR family protein n=1 Tax=Pontibacter sp. 13R65 TaxID=3127458 RepID=UPI00301B8D21
MNYLNYGAADFAADYFFIRWVNEGTAEQNTFWSDWLEEHPEKYETILEARKLVTLLSQDEDDMQDAELETIWTKLKQARNEYAAQQATEARIIPFQPWTSTFRLVAAAAIGLLICMVGFLLYNSGEPSTIEYATNFGERRTIYLPDSSMVVLNANSKITIPADWQTDKPREVDLIGEAYFSVTHQVNNQKFLVHTQNGLQVEVLGTEFSVSDKKGKERVVLASGKVRLNIGRGNSQEHLIMKPGEMVEVSNKLQKATVKEVRPEIYTSWKDNKLILDNTSLGEIATMLEEDYGYAVIFEDKSIMNQRMTAFLNESSMSNILVAISETFDVKIQKERQRIIIKSIPK